MRLKIIQIGTSLGIIIPKDVIKAMKLKQGDYVNVVITNEKDPSEIISSLKREIEKANEVIASLLEEIKKRTGEYF